MICPNCGKKTLAKKLPLLEMDVKDFLCCRCWKSAPLSEWKSYHPKGKYRW